MADRIKNYQQEDDQITTLKEIRTDLGVTPSSYTPDATVVTKDRVVTFAQAEEELVVLSDIEKGVKQQVTEVDIAQKDIANIKALLQGHLYDYQTDSTSAYTKTVPSGAMPYAGIEQIGGKTVVWNQLCNHSASTATEGGVTFTNNGDGSWTVAVSDSITATDKMLNTAIHLIKNHKYLIRGCPAGGDYYSSYYIRVNGLSDETPYTVDSGSGVIVTCLADSNYGYVFISTKNSTPEGTYTFYPQLVDITLMFGAGNEPSTVAEFESIFPADYYEYNAGTLLSAGVTEVESVGKNLLFIGSVSGGANGIVTTYNSTTQEIHMTGTSTGNGDTTITLAKNIKLKSGEKLTVSVQGSGSISGTNYVFLKNTDNSYFTYGGLGVISTGVLGTTFTMSQDQEIKELLYRVSNGQNVNITVHIQAEKGETVTPYSKPFTATYPIPAAIRNLEGYGWSAIGVYNEIDFERKEFIKRVGAVDLGTLTWLVTSSCFYAAMPSDSKTIRAAGIYNILCSRFIRYRTSSIVELASVEKVMSVNNANFYSDKTVFIHDSSYSDAATFKTAMSGVYLYYELDTPVEVDISAYLTDDNLIQVESGGTLTFPNSNGTDYQIPVPSEEEYMIDLQSALGE